MATGYYVLAAAVLMQAVTIAVTLFYVGRLHGRLDSMAAEVATARARGMHALELIDFVGDGLRELEARVEAIEEARHGGSTQVR